MYIKEENSNSDFYEKRREVKKYEKSDFEKRT